MMRLIIGVLDVVVFLLLNVPQNLSKICVVCVYIVCTFALKNKQSLKKIQRERDTDEFLIGFPVLFVLIFFLCFLFVNCLAH